MSHQNKCFVFNVTTFFFHIPIKIIVQGEGEVIKKS